MGGLLRSNQMEARQKNRRSGRGAAVYEPFRRGAYARSTMKTIVTVTLASLLVSGVVVVGAVVVVALAVL